MLRLMLFIPILLFGYSLSYAQEEAYTEPDGFYIEPIYSVDVLISDSFSTNDPIMFLLLPLNTNGFLSLGSEIGYYRGARSYGLQLKYGMGLVDSDLSEDGFINGETVYHDMYQIGAVTSGRILGTKTRNTFQARLNYRTMLGFYYFKGERYYKEDRNSAGYAKDITNYAFGLELGLNVQLGFRPTSASAVLLTFEPFNIQLNSVGAGAGISRVGLMFQF